MRAGLGRQVQPRFFLGQVPLAGLDRQRTAGRHGVAGVDHQVHQHLLDHPAVGANLERPRVERQPHADVLTDDALHHLGDVADDGVEIDVTRLEHLPPAEGQQLLGQARPFGRLHVTRGARGYSPPAFLGTAALDHCEDVVEVVSDAAGELTDPSIFCD